MLSYAQSTALCVWLRCLWDTAVNGSGQIYHYYECGQRHRSYTHCDVLTTRAELVDTAVWDWLQGLLRTSHAGSDDQHTLLMHVFGTGVSATELALQSTDFMVQRQLVERLDLHGTLAREAGQRILYLEWAGNIVRLALGQPAASSFDLQH